MVKAWYKLVPLRPKAHCKRCFSTSEIEVCLTFPQTTLSSNSAMLIISFSIALAIAAAALKCPDGTTDKNGTCIQCAPGYYRQASRKNDERPKECLACPPGTSQSAFGAVAVDLCRPCIPGTYAPNEASVECKKCPDDTTSSFGAKTCFSCEAGSIVSPNGAGCEPCQSGTFSSERNSFECTTCPYLTATDGVGATSISDCKPCTGGPNCRRCGPSAYYENYNNPENAIESDYSWLVCRECPSGTFYNGTKAITSDSQCRPCPVGTFRNVAEYSSDCKPCKDGRSTAAPGGMFCRHDGEPCPSDTYKADDGNCKFCDRGYRFVPDKNTCEKCPRGFISVGGLTTVCRKCPSNMRPDVDQRVCVCAAGKYLAGNRCISCPKGTETGVAYTLFRSCFPCTGGVAPREGSAVCKPCPLGLIPNENSTACAECPKGLMPNILDESDSGNTQCVVPQTRCPPLTRRTTVGAGYSFFGCEDISCTRESDESDLGVTCKGCEPGYYLAENGRGCKRCSPHSVSDGGLATWCTKCTAGRVADFSRGVGSTCVCSGFSRMGYGMQGGVCKKCPPGTYSDFEDEICLQCPSGTIIDADQTKCQKCPSYQVPNNGNTGCVPCPEGTMPNRRSGADKCL